MKLLKKSIFLLGYLIISHAMAADKTNKEPVTQEKYHTSQITVHAFDGHPESISFYPTALIADNQVITYIAGTPVVTSPYLGDRPAFDGSDYIVNISSINRDVRLMQQRRELYRAYQRIGYPTPNNPIIAISGKVVPLASLGSPYVGETSGDITLAASELDVAAILNSQVEGFISVTYDDGPPQNGGPRYANSAFRLGLGFVNIGNLDQSPFYFTAGQLFVPFGRYSSAMVTSTLPLILGRTKSRPFILGYKSQEKSGNYLALYGFKSETTLGHSGVVGVNWGYVFTGPDLMAEIGAGYLSTIADATGMQDTSAPPGTTFGGFGSTFNGSEAVQKTPGVDVHANISIDRYSLTAEWVGAARPFLPQDLSFNNKGAQPSAGQLEAGITFIAFAKPASFNAGYQWTNQALALRLPKHRINAVFSTSTWKDTVESIEFRHEIDYPVNTVANGAAPQGAMNQPNLGTGHSSNTVLFNVGVYF